MCIALLATSHPKYALIVLDSREEYILRPTSRPHFWTHRPSGNTILSSRDLLRRERGTWMGITKTGRLAVLTNFREHVDPADAHNVFGVKSRGEIVNAWLGAPEEESLDAFVERTLAEKLMKGVGGFSLICGDLKARPRTSGTDGGVNGEQKALGPLVVISNRSEAVSGVPRIGGERDGVWGLSNTIYEDSPTWPKIVLGRRLARDAIEKAVSQNASEEELFDLLFGVLDTNTMPARDPGLDHESYVDQLKNSIFCPAISDEEKDRDMAAAVARGKMKPAFDEIEDESRELAEESDHPDAPAIFDRGAYGTQRQTVILVDWEGRVTYKERALWDAHGNPIERGEGDVVIEYDIEGWR
ncbi:NRDE protein-domain-containing protein [Truncatella angustata]|uniref:NRDE protein-domain-containing protein n=1 Tax=Truncatella angustata TaxID=152316 RepID=A0A9P8RNN3_9PEZI|nr:NRDE protein-domain-containing protein [Truncatella angustata]KAH6647328.1 NRDE protein-domain-containing protein [Truncatella angustata]KAH8203188.1 hypothetical protein TruAng_002709 [Truncatella angustata]